MDRLKINPKNGKILFFSDLHLGVHQNSQTWHNIALGVGEWIASVMQEQRINTIIFAGDVFHDRHEIGVNTLHTAKKFFDLLSDYNIYIIPGNHDSFLSSTVEVNSAEILSNKNVFVFSKPTVLEVDEKTILLSPWKTPLPPLETRFDYIIGHFDIVNFKMTANKICEEGTSSKELFERTKNVITGHFHCRQFRNYPEGNILYLGSPYEMDFGDRDQNKGVTIVDIAEEQFAFVENTLSPKHFRLEINNLIEKKYSNLAEIVKNNIISIYVNKKVDPLTLDLLNAKLSQQGALQLRTEFNILDEAQMDTKDIKKLSIDIETAFSEFIEQIDCTCSKSDVLEKCIELYKSSITTYE